MTTAQELEEKLKAYHDKLSDLENREKAVELKIHKSLQSLSDRKAKLHEKESSLDQTIDKIVQ